MLDVERKPSSERLRLGHANRVAGETRQVSLLLLLLFAIFALTVAHDEIIAEFVQVGWLPAARAEVWELLLCAGLFAAWSVVVMRLISLLQAARDEGDARG
nr:hypothetical protein [uncultured Celeribacter sp.]